MTPDEFREKAETDMLAVHPEPEDTCQPVEVDGEVIRVRGFGELKERDRAFAAEIVRAARRKFEAEPVAERLRQEIAGVLRDAPGRWNIRARTDAVMAALDRFLDIGDAEAWCKVCRRVWDGPRHQCESDAEQRLALAREIHQEACRTARAEAGPHALCSMCDALDQSAPAAADRPDWIDREVAAGVQRGDEAADACRALYEQWVKAGPPPLGASMARWWDRRLVELHNAIHPPTDTTTEK